MTPRQLPIPGRFSTGFLSAYRMPHLSPYILNVGPVFATMAGHIHREFQPAPHADFVECITQMVLNHLFRRAHNAADLAIGESLPYQDGDLNFLGCKAFAGGHDCASSRLNMAIASFTRFLPSRIPARRNKVRKCCLTVRGLIFS